VAYDNSEPSKKALDKGLELLKEDDDLILVSVVPTVIIKEFADVDAEITIAKTQRLVNDAITALKVKGIEAIGLVREGDIADEVLTIAQQMECDLIVVGYKGWSKTGRFALGSVADKIARHATRPVLIVR